MGKDLSVANTASAALPEARESGCSVIVGSAQGSAVPAGAGILVLRGRRGRWAARVRLLVATSVSLVMIGGTAEGLSATWNLTGGAVMRTAAGQGMAGGFPLAGMAAAASLAQPLETRLSAGTTGLLRTLRKRARQFGRNLRYGLGRWSAWFGALVVFGVLAVILPLLGRDSLRTFREEGLAAFLSELSLAVAVYVRLLIDGRTPFVGKALLAFAVVYGAASHDLVPDRRSPLTFLDDVILLVLASRSFMMLCPQDIVDEHALAAAQARARNLQKKLRRRQRAVKQRASRSEAAEPQ